MADDGLDKNVLGDPLTEQLALPGARNDDAYFAALDASDDNEQWPGHAARRGVRMRVPMLVLLALLLAAGAFWGGAAVQRDHGSSTSGFAALASRFASGARGASTTSGAGGASRSFLGDTGSAPAATGTVTAIEGSTLYLTETSGQIVEVEIPSSATVTRDATATATSLHPGDTVVVEGTTAKKSGVVTATSVAATQKGVTAAAGTFGDFGSFGGSKGSTARTSGG